jgi:glycerol-3-phosphate acyltransferase PlsY
MSILYILLGYFCGSIPFGLIFAKWLKLGDIRKIGSGNIGATNVLRTGNKLAAILTLLLDLLKGLFPVWLYIFQHSDTDFKVIYVAFAAICGHIFPIWTKFKGGKGVATMAGTYIMIFPLYSLILSMIWVTVFICSRISSLSTLTTFCLGAPLLGIVDIFWKHFFSFFIYSILCAITIIITHRQNIQRLLAGKELKIK